MKIFWIALSFYCTESNIPILATNIGQIDEVMLTEVTQYGFKMSAQHFDKIEKKVYDEGKFLINKTYNRLQNPKRFFF